MESTYRQKVLQLFPDAVVKKIVKYIILNKGNILGSGYTAKEAWKNSHQRNGVKC